MWNQFTKCRNIYSMLKGSMGEKEVFPGHSLKSMDFIPVSYC